MQEPPNPFQNLEEQEAGRPHPGPELQSQPRPGRTPASQAPAANGPPGGRRRDQRPNTQEPGERKKPNQGIIILFIVLALVAAITLFAVFGRNGEEESNTGEQLPAVQEDQSEITAAIRDLQDRLNRMEQTQRAPTATASPATTPNPPITQSPEPPPTPAPAAAPTPHAAPQPHPEGTGEPPTPAAPPAATATPVQEGQRPGICGRSPAIQDAILSKIGTVSCRTVTVDELFRITGLPPVAWTGLPKPGDFTGLNNVTAFDFTDPGETESARSLPPNVFTGLSGVQSMTLEVHGLEANALAGMDSLTNLTLNVPTEGAIHPGAFAGLPELERLSLRAAAPASEEFDKREFLPVLDRLPSIHTVELEAEGWIIPLKAGQFKNLPNLQRVYITGAIPAEEPLKVYWMPASLFQNNARLSGLEVTIHGPVSIVKAPPELVEHLQGLRRLAFRYTPAEDAPDEDKLRLRLSISSPLLEEITNGRQEATGYEVVFLPAKGRTQE